MSTEYTSNYSVVRWQCLGTVWKLLYQGSRLNLIFFLSSIINILFGPYPWQKLHHPTHNISKQFNIMKFIQLFFSIDKIILQQFQNNGKLNKIMLPGNTRYFRHSIYSPGLSLLDFTFDFIVTPFSLKMQNQHLKTLPLANKKTTFPFFERPSTQINST